MHTNPEQTVENDQNIFGTRHRPHRSNYQIEITLTLVLLPLQQRFDDDPRDADDCVAHYTLFCWDCLLRCSLHTHTHTHSLTVTLQAHMRTSADRTQSQCTE